MSQKILEATEKVLEQMNASEDVADFVRGIVAFECFEKTFQFKKRYMDELKKVTAN